MKLIKKLSLIFLLTAIPRAHSANNTLTIDVSCKRTPYCYENEDCNSTIQYMIRTHDISLNGTKLLPVSPKVRFDKMNSSGELIIRKSQGSILIGHVDLNILQCDQQDVDTKTLPIYGFHLSDLELHEVSGTECTRVSSRDINGSNIWVRKVEMGIRSKFSKRLLFKSKLETVQCL